jgi:hypothetical protein
MILLFFDSPIIPIRTTSNFGRPAKMLSHDTKIILRLNKALALFGISPSLGPGP